MFEGLSRAKSNFLNNPRNRSNNKKPENLPESIDRASDDTSENQGDQSAQNGQNGQNGLYAPRGLGSALEEKWDCVRHQLYRIHTTPKI